MKRYLLPRWTPAVVFLLTILATAGMAKCGGNPTPASVTTPQGKVAYQATDALDALATLQHATIAARRAGIITDNHTLHLVIDGVRAATQTINDAIDNGTGTPAVYKDVAAALTRTEAALPPAVQTKLSLEFTSVLTILAALAPAGA